MVGPGWGWPRVVPLGLVLSAAVTRPAARDCECPPGLGVDGEGQEALFVLGYKPLPHSVLPGVPRCR